MVTEYSDLPISLLRQYCFCQRIPFLILVRGLTPPRGAWVSRGIDFHMAMNKLMKRRDLSRFGLTPPYTLESEKQGLRSLTWHTRHLRLPDYGCQQQPVSSRAQDEGTLRCFPSGTNSTDCLWSSTGRNDWPKHYTWIYPAWEKLQEHHDTLHTQSPHGCEPNHSLYQAGCQYWLTAS